MEKYSFELQSELAVFSTEYHFLLARMTNKFGYSDLALKKIINKVSLPLQQKQLTMLKKIFWKICICYLNLTASHYLNDFFYEINDDINNMIF